MTKRDLTRNLSKQDDMKKTIICKISSQKAGLKREIIDNNKTSFNSENNAHPPNDGKKVHIK